MTTAHELGAALGVAVLAAVAMSNGNPVSGYGDGFFVAAAIAGLLAFVAAIALPAFGRRREHMFRCTESGPRIADGTHLDVVVARPSAIRSDRRIRADALMNIAAVTHPSACSPPRAGGALGSRRRLGDGGDTAGVLVARRADGLRDGPGADRVGLHRLRGCRWTPGLIAVESGSLGSSLSSPRRRSRDHRGCWCRSRGHGLKDLWQHRRQFVANTRWWPPFCLVVDWTSGAIVAVEIIGRRALPPLAG